MEIWKNIIGYEGLYEVSNEGRVKSLDREIPHAKYGTWKRKGKLLSATNHKNGYKLVWLPNAKTVHRLVAEAFIPNPNNYPIIMHIDNNPSNNSVSNLQWGTQAQNVLQCVRDGRHNNQYTK